MFGFVKGRCLEASCRCERAVRLWFVHLGSRYVAYEQGFGLFEIMYNALHVKNISNLQDAHSSAQAERHWLAAHSRPQDQRLASHLIACRASSAAHTGRSWECNGHWNAASVAVCSRDGSTCDGLAIGRVRVRQLRAA